jgi:hypothetical protein
MRERRASCRDFLSKATPPGALGAGDAFDDARE